MQWLEVVHESIVLPFSIKRFEMQMRDAGFCMKNVFFLEIGKYVYYLLLEHSFGPFPFGTGGGIPSNHNRL